MLDRRAFLVGTAAALLPIAGRSQPAVPVPPRVPRLAVVGATGFPVERITEDGDPYFRAFFSELRRRGYVEGRNIAIERWSFFGKAANEYANLAREIVGTQPTAIFVNAAAQAVALKAATATIPIVYVAADPLGYGLGSSLRRPGGNASGFAVDAGAEFFEKQAQMLVQCAPSATRIAYLVVPSILSVVAPQYSVAARKLNVTLSPALVEGTIDAAAIRKAFASAVAGGAKALIVTSTSAFYQLHASLIAELALSARLPALGQNRALTAAGLMMSYDSDRADLHRQAADYVDKVLKGADPGELPIQLPTRFEFIVNLKTARALGVELPLPLMGFVTEYLE